jgi:hypothetical protein
MYLITKTRSNLMTDIVLLTAAGSRDAFGKALVVCRVMWNAA